MRRFAAAVPLAIALAGTATFNSDDSRSVRFRAAANANVPTLEASLNADQLRWLNEHNPFDIPKSRETTGRVLIVREGYTLSHNSVDKIADWVAFHLTKEYVDGSEKRPGSSAFKPDPLLSKGKRAELADYKGFQGIYDRGHQAASADSKGRGLRVINESFLLSNMTPQSSPLNQQQWRLLEARIQQWAKKNGELWVVTGPMFLDDDDDGVVEYFVIGKDQVAVPTHYFKVVLAPNGDSRRPFKAIAFVIPNRKISDFGEFLTSIDEIERLTGIDIFSGLDDRIEDELEGSTQPSVWPG